MHHGIIPGERLLRLSQIQGPELTKCCMWQTTCTKPPSRGLAGGSDMHQPEQYRGEECASLFDVKNLRELAKNGRLVGRSRAGGQHGPKILQRRITCNPVS